ncbi:MADF domain-containing protein [Trichonephila clavata]|uniref:MADF domain-containing protein n=1 Tax=Trichonephila clavata TaxID=2740835 RepID=A0A8X6HH03_TRICU|nr:MADF domain-containing protein [Trichonephila clavata]
MSCYDEKLIMEVRKHSHLYDLWDRRHKNKVVRANTWRKIGLTLGIPGDLCKTRFKVLRDRYRKEKLGRIVPSKSGNKSQKQWRYLNILSFLDPYMNVKSTWTSVTETTSSPIIIPCIRDTKTEEILEVEDEEEEASNLIEDHLSTPTSKKQEINPTAERKRISEEMHDTTITQISNETGAEDLLMEFCARSIKKYPSEVRHEALEFITNYVFKLNRKYIV